MSVREYDDGGNRYYVIGVTGFKVADTPTSRLSNSTGGVNAPTTTYAVLDRDICHREVAIFEPEQGGSRHSAWCKAQAERLADELNRHEVAA